VLQVNFLNGLTSWSIGTVPRRDYKDIQMPISPSLRRSPAKEIAHKRRRSFGSTLPAKSKDDGLLLFNDLKKSERENFLLEQPDDLGESLCNSHKYPFRIFSVFCL
jgi:hypothetical protein